MKPVVLCVDDERIILSSLKRQLYPEFGEQYQIELAESGEEALEIVDECLQNGGTVPLVITDQIMGGIYGDELLANIKTRLPDTLSIMLTGQASADAVGQALNKAGLFRYIAKPWNQDDLLLTVRTALQSYKEHVQLARQQAFQRAINQVLLSVLAVDRVDEQLNEVLRIILSLPDFNTPGVGAIYLVEDGVTRLIAEQGDVDLSIGAHDIEANKHEISYSCHGASRDGCYRIPICLNDQLCALLFACVPNTHVMTSNSDLTSFLTTMVHTIAGLIRLHRYYDDLERHRNDLSRLVKNKTLALNKALEEQERNNRLLTKANQELVVLATTDDLTGLMNRRAFFKQAELELTRARRYQRQTALAILDLDFFKEVNDKFGHNIGDQLLVKIGEILSNSVRESDLVARIGGEEFAMVMPETDIPQAVELCERLRAEIETCMLDVDDQSISISVSIGVTSLRDNEPSLSSAMSRADKALYESKSKGRNLVTEN